MNICDAYHADKNFLGEIGVCWGTKEREACSCGGDKSKCDFYPSVRKEGKKPQTKGDMIRGMSDEELTDMFWEFMTDSQFKNPYREKAELLDWLKSPGEANE